MSSKAFTSSNGGDPVFPGFTFGEKMRVLRKLRELEFGMLDRGSSPEGAVLTVYKRALDFYDREWPLDEGKFRNTLIGMQEKRMRKIMSEKRRKNVCMCNTIEEGWRPCPENLCERDDHDHDDVISPYDYDNPREHGGF